MHWKRARPVAPGIAPISVHFDAHKIAGLVKTGGIASCHKRSRNRNVFTDRVPGLQKATACFQRIPAKQEALSIRLYFVYAREGLSGYAKAINQRGE